ncbi:MAG: hypothetical protein V4807_12210 [Burkholderia gladioli]
MPNSPNGAPLVDSGTGAVLATAVAQTGNLVPNGRPAVDENGAMLVVLQGGSPEPQPSVTSQRQDIQIPPQAIVSGTTFLTHASLQTTTIDFQNSYFLVTQEPAAGDTATIMYAVNNDKNGQVVPPTVLLTTDEHGVDSVVATTLTLGPRQVLLLLSAVGQSNIPQFEGCLNATVSAS